MNKRLQVVVLIALLLFLVYIFKMIRDRKIEIKYALLWMFLSLFYLILDVIPPLQAWFAGLLGISAPISMLVFFAIGIILIILLNDTVIISKQAKVITRLTQEAALANGEIEKLRKKVEESK